jgi:hypothetical protein
VALAAPTLWTDIRIVEYGSEETKEAARIYLERSKACPIFLTWFTDPEQSVPGVIEDLIIPGAERWQRITLIAGNNMVPDALLAAMEPLDFPILQDVEISGASVAGPSSPKSALCHSAPLLRRCRFRDVPFPPSLPSNLVVLDCVFTEFGLTQFDLERWLELLPHVAHSLEHLRFGLPPASKLQLTPRTSKIPLENLKSLLIMYSYVIMERILAPNLTYFAVFQPPDANAREAAEMFGRFSAPKLQSIQLRGIPLLPFLSTHNLPSMFPLLESVLLSSCIDESAFAPLLEPPRPKNPSSLTNVSKYPPKHQKVENPLPHLKELTISDMTVWTSFQAAIEKRLKNGDKSLRKIQLPKTEGTEVIMRHLSRWLPTQGIELVSYEPGWLPRSTPEFQDEFCDEETHLFFDISMEEEGSDWDEGYDYEYDYDMWGEDISSPDDEDDEDDEEGEYEGW